MPQDDSTSMDIFLSYREISMLDLVKELRQRASSMKGRVGALGDGDEVAVKREMKAIPLTMRWALFRDEEDHVSTFLLVMTSDGLIIVDQVSLSLFTLIFRSFSSFQ